LSKIVENYPLVSIITPSYNQGRFLEETIYSVLGQDYPNLEYLVIDGGSSDESIDIIHRYAKRLSYWVSEPDRGQAHAINKGLARAKGSLLGWLNADDLLLPDAVSRVVCIFNEYPEVDVVYGRLERINEDGYLLPTPKLPKDKVEFNKKLVLGECVVNQPGSLWRKQIMYKAGILDESLNYGLDYEFWIRLALAEAKFKRLPETLALFRLSSSSKTVGETEKMALEQLHIIERLLTIEDLPQKIGLTPEQIHDQVRRTKSSISLHAFYGYYKRRKWQTASYWLWQSIKLHPGILFDRRWRDLAYARLSRSFKLSKKEV
jgi:glycosyltransferase involved in cell wall biosynthesis